MEDETNPHEDPADEHLSVGTTAHLVGVSVRTLHHWDGIGLVCPGARTAGGHRVYTGADVERLHQVLVYRELGLSLADIASLLDDPDVDPVAHLARQREQLLTRITQLEGMVRAVDRMSHEKSNGMTLSPQEQAEVFGEAWRPEWPDEAAQKYQGSAQWDQYLERSQGRSKEDWRRISERSKDLDAKLAEAMRSGTRPGEPAAGALAEEHRQWMTNFFDCPYGRQVCLGRMYAADPGYAAHYDGLEPGLAAWLRDVIAENARQHGVDPDTATWD